MKRIRCPICNRYGSKKYNGYCSRCKPQVNTNKHRFSDFNNIFPVEREFIPESEKFGIESATFGLEDRK